MFDDPALLGSGKLGTEEPIFLCTRQHAALSATLTCTCCSDRKFKCTCEHCVLWQAVAGVAADGRQIVNRAVQEAVSYKKCAPTSYKKEVHIFLWGILNKNF